MTTATRYRPALWLSLALLAPAAMAQTTNGHQGHHTDPATTATPAAAPSAEAPTPATPQAAAEGAWAQAEVRRVDANTGKVTLKHGDIPNLAMPPMTMVFQVQNAQTLTNIKVGDRVRFTADQINGAYTVLQIEPAP